MLLWKTDKPRQRRQIAMAHKVLLWAVCGYMIIAALHGVSPQMWRHHCSQGDNNGPFRILLFTLFTAIAMAIYTLALMTASGVVPLPCKPVLSAAFRSPWLLRGPPLS
jgi:hypothetical protein